MLNTISGALSIAVCDDDQNDLAHIRQMVMSYIQENEIDAQIVCYSSANEVLLAVQAGAIYQLFILDVMLGEADGICLAAELRNMKQRAEIIFISSNREMAMRGYEVAAVRYLAKPLDREKLREALHVCFLRLAIGHSIMLPTQNGRRSFDFSAIQYLEPWDGFCRVHLKEGGVELIMLKFHEFSKLLPDGQFVQIHRTLLVNMAEIRYIRRSEIELSGGERLPVSKYRIEEVRACYLEYMEK